MAISANALVHMEKVHMHRGYYWVRLGLRIEEGIYYLARFYRIVRCVVC